jgi:hypothetical protein
MADVAAAYREITVIAQNDAIALHKAQPDLRLKPYSLEQTNICIQYALKHNLRGDMLAVYKAEFRQIFNAVQSQ